MAIRRSLIALPALISAVLLVSYLWVPSYEEQTRGNPKQLRQFVTASSGDAKYLNPILSSDNTSGTINALVFEGLIDHDEELNLRCRESRPGKE